jgi:hypothetical protein
MIPPDEIKSIKRSGGGKDVCVENELKIVP